MKKPKEMSKEELREELIRIRAERSGVGRERKRTARTKRIDGVRKQDRVRKNVEAEANADWV